MAKKPETARKRKTGKSENDIYTAILGLTVLALAATAVFASLRGLELYSQIINIPFGGN